MQYYVYGGAMSYLSEKYMTQVAGNRALCRRLSLDILSGTLPHALILEGAAGSGKKLIATNIAAALACSNKDSESDSVPCLKCLECRKVLEGLCPDVIFVSRGEKATIGVDEARFVREDVKIIPNDLDHKIYVIEEADKMTEQAQNALLLTLEEPPAYATFILLCESAAALLETIRSRAPVFRTEPMSAQDIEKCILEKSEKARALNAKDPTALSQIAVAAGGTVGKALEYLDEKKFAPIKEARDIAYAFLSAIADQEKPGKVVPLLSRFSSKRDVLQFQLETLLSASVELLILKRVEDRELTFFESNQKAIEICDRISLSKLLKLCESTQEAIDENKRNANVRLLLMKLASNIGII